jgi:hypothetical protein
MRVFKVADGTSWVARLHETETGAAAARSRWQAILFETPRAGQRLVYRPSGWLQTATPDDLVAALEEGMGVRTRWGAPAPSDP